MSACKHKVSGTLSLPSRGAFHLSLTVLLLYRSSGSILAWRVGPPASHGIPRVPRYSGSSSPILHFAYVILTLFDWPSHAILLDSSGHDVSPNPKDLRPLVWPPPRSLATTCGISVDVFSSPYLDVSVQAVPHVRLFYSTHVDGVWLHRVSPFGNLRVVAYVQLTAAYRSLSRPSSAPDAKAFPLRPY